MTTNNIFKKYDIRAIIEKELPVEDIEDVSKAICSYFIAIDSDIDEIVLAIDTRLHSEDIKNSFIRATHASGLKIAYLGVCPTPVAYFATKYLNAKASVVITASHNPKDYNGFKIIYNSTPVWDMEIQKIKDIFLSKSFLCRRIDTVAYREIDIHDTYIDFLVQEFAHLKNLEINAIIDCCNGTAGSILPKLIVKMGWENVECLFAKPDGNFPNHDPDPSKEKNLVAIKDKMRLAPQNVYGFAFDGDCDRLAVIYENQLIQADKLLYIYAQSLEPNSKIVVDIKCSGALKTSLEKLKIKTIFCSTGCAYVKNGMKQHNAIFGGELSGHICFLDRYYGFDDGIYAMMRFIEIAAKKDITQILKQYPILVSEPELRIACYKNTQELICNLKSNLIEIIDQENINYSIITIDGMRIDTPNSWGIIRASNTEPMLSFRFEANSEIELKKIKILFYKAIIKYFYSEELKDKLLR